ncbi:MAG: class I SAM-dependent methyltransferase [Acidimicrobiia bacterium]|nr:class I SAM-dependent methyltransferase [Acidimicrobiia bacterium]
MKCIYCGSGDLQRVDSFSNLRTISSDAKPWRKGFLMVLCSNCGFPQAGVSPDWERSASEIYSDYATYFQTSDFDQRVFIDGNKSWRGDLFVGSVLERCKTKAGGSVLDFGCGAGNLLRSFAKSRADIDLYGYDLDDRELGNLQTIKNFKQLLVGKLNTDRKFDLILMSHTLEHLTKPRESLAQLRGLLKGDGYLAIAVPDCSIDPFKLLIADHCSHFSKKTLKVFLQNAGFEVVQIETTLETRECWAICRPSKSETTTDLSKIDTDWVARSIEWINLVRDNARSVSARDSFGIFGTSINALWLFGELELDVDFFVDEDSSRQGKKLFGRPVISPSMIVKDSTVYLPFIPNLATKIAKRLESGNVFWAIPPAGEWFKSN